MTDHERITRPGVYDIPNRDYHADPCPVPSLSNSLAKILLDGAPQHAWDGHPRLNPNFEEKTEDKFVIGTAAHSLMLGSPEDFAILDFDTYQTKIAKQAKADAIEADKVPILSKYWDRVVEMVDVGRAQLAAHLDASDAFTNGKPEQTLVWKENILGYEIWCRAKLDWNPNEGVIFDDYKTTGEYANPETYGKTLFNVGHDFQAAFYKRGIKAVLGVARPRFRFIVQENFKPYGLLAVELENDSLELAERRVATAMRRWAWCMKSGDWPGYPARTVKVSAPSWHENDQMERELRYEAMAAEHKADPDLLDIALKWQAPI